MYSERITKRMIDAASAEQGWTLTYHTREQIDEAIAHFESLIDDDGELSRALSKDEQRWIQNERKVCALDFRYWLNYAKIVDLEKKIVHPKLNVGQRITMDIWAEHEERGIAIILLHLKARQLGISTLYELANCHRFQFWPNSNIIIASADPQKTVAMAKMISFCIESQPWWLLPDCSMENTIQSKNMIVGFKDINTSISIEAGNKFHGLARGATPNCGHLSELSSWDNAKDDVDAAFIRAVHETPDVFVGLESTALGTDNWFAEKWESVKKNWPLGRSRMRGVFLPWYVGTDLYPMPNDMWRFRQMEQEGWTPNARTLHHAERARKYVLANPLLFKHLANGNPNWTMPKEQMWYYEIERETAVEEKTLNRYLGELPSDDAEAFQNTGISVIDQDIILTYRDQVRHPEGVYAIVGPGIHQSLIPSRSQWLTGPDAPPIIRVPVSPVTRSDEVYQFVPLKFDGYPGYDPSLKLFIYEWPEPNQTYGFGVDTSDGIGENASAVEGFRLGGNGRNHAQVCEFASSYIKADQLWSMALAIGAFYSVLQEHIGRRTQARICVECRGNGETVQNELKKRGWMNFHPWKAYDNKRRTPDAMVTKEGVYTNVWFRSMMMDKFLTAIDEQALDLPSYWLVNEMASLEREPDEVSARAASGKLDDRVIALCFPLFSLTVEQRPSKQYRKSTPNYLPDALDEEPVGPTRYATWQPAENGNSLMTTVAHRVVRGRNGRAALSPYRARVGGGW